MLARPLRREVEAAVLDDDAADDAADMADRRRSIDAALVENIVLLLSDDGGGHAKTKKMKVPRPSRRLYPSPLGVSLPALCKLALSPRGEEMIIKMR